MNTLERPVISSKSAHRRIAVAAIAGYYINETASRQGPRKVVNKIAELVVNKSAQPKTELSESFAHTYKERLQKTEYWHGTGRRQYDEKGNVVDILESILKTGGLVTHEDSFDPIAGTMRTISLAKSRMYARSYADIHGAGKYETERHGSSTFWAQYFIGSCATEAIMEVRPWTKEGRLKADAIRAMELPNWGAKVNSAIKGWLTPFFVGSDISNNYPILVGLDGESAKRTHMSKALSLHELRTSNNIGLEHITHIEVPRANLQETELLIASYGHSMSVIPIEDAEVYASHQPFTELTRPITA